MSSKETCPFHPGYQVCNYKIDGVLLFSQWMWIWRGITYFIKILIKYLI